MARFYTISIGGIYLTDTGLVGGRPCKTELQGISALLIPDQGNISVGADGTPFREKPLIATGGGRGFAIIAAFMAKSVYDTIKSALDTAATANASINIVGAGTPGNFDVDAIVFDNPQYISYAGFSGDNLKGVTISLITTAIN